MSRSAPSQVPVPSPKDSELPPRGVTYFRGALVLHTLRVDLGEDAFWTAVRSYLHNRAWKGARTENLRAAMEAASGKDLRKFFETRIYAIAPSDP